MKHILLVMGVSLALAVGGCTNVKDSHRQSVDMNIQIAEQVLQAADTIDAVAAGNSLMGPPLTSASAALRQLASDLLNLNKQLQANIGKPEEPKKYSHEEVERLLNQLKKEQSGGILKWLLGALLVGGSTALAFARKYGKLIPGFGPIFEVADSTFAAVEKWIQERKAKGDVEAATDLAATLAEQHKNDRVGAFAARLLDKAKKKLVGSGDLAVSHPPEDPPAPTPTATPNKPG